MKTQFFLLCAILFFCLSGCGPSKAEMEAKERQGLKWNDKTGGWGKPQSQNIYDTSSDNEQLIADDIEIRIIDSCEYIIFQKYNAGGWSSGITHKANCRNPIHQNK